MFHPYQPPTGDDEARYLRRLDQALLAPASEGIHSLSEYVDSALGADPFMVSSRLRTLGVSLPVDRPAASVDETSVEWVPELHPLDFEWYFAASVATELAQMALGLGVDLLCLGAPTVAYAATPLVETATDLLLVDRTHLARRRAPSNRQGFDFLIHDLDAPLVFDRTFSVAVFDAPWYPEHLYSWLAQAGRIVSPGGYVLFPLLGELHRPTASRDRAQVLDYASALGHVEIHPAAVVYQSPLFERLALARRALHVSTHWRKADLVVLRLNRSPRALDVMAPQPTREFWETFVLGTQVVKLRKRVPDPEPHLLSPIAGCPNFAYDGISARDPRRPMIDLWTSRNRVARVTRADLLHPILGFIAEGHRISDAVSRVLAGHAAKDRETTLHALEQVLDATER